MTAMVSMESREAKVFNHHNHQAITIPVDFRLNVEKVRIFRDGDTLVIEPIYENDLDVDFPEIKKLNAEIAEIREESNKRIRQSQLEHDRMRAEFAKMAIERAKIEAERAKIEKETACYPLVATAAATGAGAALMGGAGLLRKR